MKEELLYIILGAIQGFGEFLPISSSAHVAAFNNFFHLPNGRSIEITLHFGTLLSVIAYFSKTFWFMALGIVRCSTQRKKNSNNKSLNQLIHIIAGTLPAISVGFVIHMLFPSPSEALYLLGFMSIFSGCLLWIVDNTAGKGRRLDDMTVTHALIIGFFQCFALIPGGSRLGTTLLGARFLGYDRASSLIFSYWLSVPVVMGALILNLVKMLKTPEHFETIFSPNIILSITTAFFIGLAVIHILFKWLQKHSFAPFMFYRILFGCVLIFLYLRS